MTNLTGQLVGRYRILEVLGEGGMATVYKAFDAQLEREVAVKFIRSESFGGEDPEVTLKRFRREARLLAKLNHPNILTLLDYGEYEGQLYLVTTYAPGGSLKAQLGRPMPWEQAVRLLGPVARALEYAHGQGILHRDIKPANILLSSTSLPLLADFGIAKVLESISPGAQSATHTDLGQLTGTDATIGTPEYMAPEQGRGKADHRSDIYSLGIVFYEMLAGRRPFIADTQLEVLLMHVSDPLPSPRQFVPDLPRELEQILHKSLAKKPEERYQSMGEFAQALDRLLFSKSRRLPVKGTLQREQVAPKPRPTRTDLPVTKTEEPVSSGKPAKAKSEGKKHLWARREQKPRPTRTDLPFTKTEEPASSGKPGKAKSEGKKGFLARREQKARSTRTDLPVTESELPASSGKTGKTKARAASRLHAWLKGKVSKTQANRTDVPTRKRSSRARERIRTTFFEKPRAFLKTRKGKLMAGGMACLLLLSTALILGFPALVKLAGRTIVSTSTIDSGSGIGSTLISPTDGMTLVYVPQGEFTMGSEDFEGDAIPAHRVYLDAFWIDRTEVTNAMYAQCVQAGVCQPPVDNGWHRVNFGENYYGNPQYDNYPVVWVSWDDANIYCEWAGRRLPTEAEWEKAARGMDERLYPWGNQTPDSSLLNFGDHGGHTTEVGYYPAGASPYGALDMAGNAWEWTSSLYRPYPYRADDGREDMQDRGRRVLRSGSWDNPANDVRVTYRNVNSDDSLPFQRSPSLGFRCVSSQASNAPTFLPAATPTRTRTPAPTTAPTPTTTSTPGIGSTTIRSQDGMAMVYVPEGLFTMGETAGLLDTTHPIYLDAFWIDQTEVTNAMYALCVAVGACQTPGTTILRPQSNPYSDPFEYYGDPEFADYPVIFMTWEDSAAYCQWAGARLPTDAEWEKAARGTEGLAYPWGNSLPTCELANYRGRRGNCDGGWCPCVGSPDRVGSYPAGASPYGALDMAGNVAEWVYDWYRYDTRGDYYLSTPAVNPTGPVSGSRRVLRNSAWDFLGDTIRSAQRGGSGKLGDISFHGFRCSINALP